MPRLTMLVDITASASRPGTRKSGGLAATAPKKTISTTGTTIVIRRLSVRRNVRISSTRSCAARAFIAAHQSDRRRRPEAGRATMGAVDQHLIEHVRRTIGVPLTEDEATALAQWYANIA